MSVTQDSYQLVDLETPSKSNERRSTLLKKWADVPNWGKTHSQMILY